jgi:hypothetical protein
LSWTGETKWPRRGSNAGLQPSSPPMLQATRALWAADEIGTLKMLTERRAILDKLIADHRGRIANTAGDSVLAEFGSAVE